MPKPTSPIVLAATGFLTLAAAMGIGRFAFTPLLPMMQSEGILDVPGGGALASVHFVGYLIGAYLAAWLPARPRLVVTLSLVAIGLSTASMGLTENAIAWSAFRFIAGLCSAFSLVFVGLHIVRRLAEADRTDLQGWVFSGVGAGIAFAGLMTLAMMAGDETSDTGWIVSGVAAFAVAAITWLALGGQAGPSSNETPKVVRTPLSWPIVIAYGVVGGGYIIPATFLPIMARDIVSDPLLFGWGWPIFGAAAFLSTILAASLYARFTNLQIWTVSQYVMAAGLVLPVILPHIATIILAALCVGGTFVIITMVGIKHAHVIAPGDAQHHIAALTTAFAAGQMIAPVLAGWAYEAVGGFALSLVVTSVALLVTVRGLSKPRIDTELA